MPRYSLGAVAKALAGVNPETTRTCCSARCPAGLLLTLYVAIFLIAGMLLMQRRDVTA